MFTAKTIGQVADEMYDLRERKRALEAEIKQLTTEYEELEDQLLDMMDAQQVTRSSGAQAPVRVDIDEVVKPDVQDWDLFYDFIAQNRYFHLLERRPTVTGYRELLALGRAVPGVVPFTKRRPKLTTNSR